MAEESSLPPRPQFDTSTNPNSVSTPIRRIPAALARPLPTQRHGFGTPRVPAAPEPAAGRVAVALLQLTDAQRLDVRGSLARGPLLAGGVFQDRGHVPTRNPHDRPVRVAIASHPPDRLDQGVPDQ